MRWTDKQAETAIRMAAEGHSAGEISRALNGEKSRNAVVGYLVRRKKRLAGGKIRLRSRRTQPMIRVRAATQAVNAASDAAGTRVSLMDRRPDQCRWIVAGRGAEALYCGLQRAGTRVSLMDRRPDQCRWIVAGRGAEALYCGLQRAGKGPYCQGHETASLESHARRRIQPSIPKIEFQTPPQPSAQSGDAL